MFGKRDEHTKKYHKTQNAATESISTNTFSIRVSSTFQSSYFTILEILSFDDEAAAHYGHVRAYLEKKGLPIGPLDLMIAAHAQSLNTILVTNNKKEFSRVPHLKIEDWVHTGN